MNYGIEESFGRYDSLYSAATTSCLYEVSGKQISCNTVDLLPSAGKSSKTIVLGNLHTDSAFILNSSSIHTLDTNNNSYPTPGKGSVNFGICSISSGDYSIAFGLCNRSLCAYSTAIGFCNFVNNCYSTAIGCQHQVTGCFATAIGIQNYGSGIASFATGAYTSAVGNYSSAFGSGTKAIGFSSIAIGYNSCSVGDMSFSTGYDVINRGCKSSAFGSGTQIGCTSNKIFAVGYGTDSKYNITDDYNVHFSIDCNGMTCTKQIKIIDGTQGAGKVLVSDTNGLASWAIPTSGGTPGLCVINSGYGTYYRAVNPNNYGTIGTSSVDLSFSSTATCYYGAVGCYSFTAGAHTRTGDFGIAMGNTTIAGVSSIALGSSITAGDYSIAIGTNAVSCMYGLAIGGGGTISNGAGAIAIGYVSCACAEGSIALGTCVTAIGNYSTAIGYNTCATGCNSTAMGINTIASGYASTAIGRSTAASTIGSISHSSGNYHNSCVTPMQTTTVLLRARSTSTTAVVATADAGSPNINVGSKNIFSLAVFSSAATYRLTVLAKQAGSDTTEANVKAFEVKGILVIGADVASTTIVGNTVTVLGGTLPCSLAISADTTLGGLKVECASGGTEVIYWEVRVETVEIQGYAT
jgi:hypothetical protein